MLDRKARLNLLSISQRHETPFFALDLQKLKSNEREFLQTARDFFAKVKVCYSVKTNPLPQVLKTLSTGFEVASLQELQAVKRKKTFKVFNGCCKKEGEILEALRQNVLVIVDSFSELEKIKRLKQKLKLKKLDVGVRLNVASKFGIELSKIREFVKAAEQSGLKVVMLHAHPGVQNNLRDYKQYLQAFKNAASLHDFGIFDLGSGFPSNSKLAEQNVSLNDFFQAVKQELGTIINGKTLIFEPGRILVADSMFLVCKVCAVKELNGEKLAVLDVGINVLQKIVLEDFKFSPLVEKPVAKGSVKLAGPLLFGNDFLGTTNFDLKEGDYVIVENVGAYCHSLAWEISYKKPKVFLL